MLTDQELAELESKHGEVLRLRSKRGDWECVFRRPTRAETRLFRANVHNPAKVADAQELLSRACVIHPSREEYERLLDRYPGIPDSPGFSQGISRLMELDAEEAGKD